MVWGIEFLRGIHRVQESLMWPGRPKAVRGSMLPLGVLLGINNIPDPKQLEVIPYTLIGQSTKTRLDMGLDFPLWAHIEFNNETDLQPGLWTGGGPDPSVLNLTAFETFYDEKRPFFSPRELNFSVSVYPCFILDGSVEHQAILFRKMVS
ncbi:MAG: hypothetical protein Ct9H300mP9_3450 [Candidatus Neomarinimicrobiota bacterium]|nr:MAG: hypothetical protein Ct9H300mP9_3450 [Candidatus Neomarinimicrobiota bacterium]